MQRTDGTGLRKFRVERVSDLERVGVDDDDGVERRALFIVCVNAIEIDLDQHATRQRLRFERRLDVGDRRFVVMQDIEGARVHGSGEQKTNKRNCPRP